MNTFEISLMKQINFIQIFLYILNLQRLYKIYFLHRGTGQYIMTMRLLCTILLATLLITSSHQASVVVNQLSGISTGNLVYSGLLPISDTSSDQLFFTYYSAKDAKQEADIASYPLIVVVGSPGSSAQYYNLAGLGPVLIKPDMTTTPNPNTATQFANLMFIDLLGNGFSFVGDIANFPTKAEDYGAHLTYALNALVKQSVLGKVKNIVIMGEGMFVRSLTGLGDITGLSGLVHISAWTQLYAMSRYYGVAGIQLKIFTNSQRVAIQSTLVSCYNNVISKKYPQAHNCYDSILNFVQSKTKNVNVFNTKLASNLTQHLPMIQYYFSLPSIVSQFKAPTAHLFQSQSNWVFSKTYNDFAVNKTQLLSQFMRDNLDIRHWYVSGDYDYIAFKQSLKFWLENQLTFIESVAFKNAKLEDTIVGGNIVGYSKQVKQLKYTELIGSGHYVAVDQPDVFVALLKDWVAGLGQDQQQQRHITSEKLQLSQQ